VVSYAARLSTSPEFRLNRSHVSCASLTEQRRKDEHPGHRGTGTLGRLVTPFLRDAGHQVTVLSRHPVDGVAHVTADLRTGEASIWPAPRPSCTWQVARRATTRPPGTWSALRSTPACGTWSTSRWSAPTGSRFHDLALDAQKQPPLRRLTSALGGP
jgi:hypothetical protein